MTSVRSARASRPITLAPRTGRIPRHSPTAALSTAMHAKTSKGIASGGILRPCSNAGTSQIAINPTRGIRDSGATGVPPTSSTSGGKLVIGIRTSSASHNAWTVN